MLSLCYRANCASPDKFEKSDLHFFLVAFFVHFYSFLNGSKLEILSSGDKNVSKYFFKGAYYARKHFSKMLARALICFILL